jgi:hypothetical protein
MVLTDVFYIIGFLKQSEGSGSSSSRSRSRATYKCLKKGFYKKMVFGKGTTSLVIAHLAQFG